MQKILAYLLLSSLAVLGACASTTEMDPDGQTHWMTRCDDNADCGELSCICGVCTETCTASDECSIGDGSEASCQRTASVLDTTACTTRQAAARVCVPLCEAQSDCTGVASDLTCTSDDVCAVDERQVIDIDSSVPMDRDATIDEQAPPVSGPVTPIELACDEDGSLEGTGPFVVVASGELGDSLAIAPDGTIFGTATIDSVRNSAMRIVDGEIDDFGNELWELQRLYVDDSDLITGKSDGYEATIAATDLETQAKLTLARKDALNVTALTADDDAVYWVAQLEQDPPRSQLWRSPRSPGESVLLAEVEGFLYDLVMLNGDLFFFGSITGSWELNSIAKDGSSAAITSHEVPETAGVLRSDGRHLFFALGTETDDLGNPLPGERGIVRMDPVTLQSETVLDTGSDELSSMILGGPDIYWTTNHTVEDFEPILKLWRGASNGSGEPYLLGMLEAYAGPFAEHNGELYWISTCRIGNDGTTKSHIVRKTD